MLRFDVIADIRGLIDVSCLIIRSYNPASTLTKQTTWHNLQHLHLQLHQRDSQPADILLELGRDSFPNISRVTLDVHNSMRYVDFFLLNVSDSITELALYYDGFTADGLAIPSCKQLHTLSCYVHNAQSLLAEPMTSLRTLKLHGLGPNSHIHPRQPQVHTAHNLDLLLLHLQATSLAAALTKIQLHPFHVEDFYTHPWDLRELAIYAYWGLHASDVHFKFIFLDSNEQPG